MLSPKILITGGAGFIGSALGENLVERRSAEVLAFDSLLEQVHPSGRPPKTFNASIQLLRRDVRDRDAWRELFASYKPDYVVHFAAETGTAQSLTESARHSSVNVLGTSELVDALGRGGQRPKKILLASSRSVYGEGAWRTDSGVVFYPGRRSHKQLSQGRWDFSGPDGEMARALPHLAGSTFPNPSSIYAATKLAQEHILASWCEAFDVPLSILRFQNVYGPGQSPLNPYTGIINIFHRVAARGLQIDVYEDGNIGRDFVFIDDVVEACVASLFDGRVEPFFCDVGYGSPTTIHDAAKIIAQLHKAPEPIVSGKFRDGDVRWAVANTKTMMERLGVTPAVDFKMGAQLVGDWLAKEGHLLD
jgi:dTDP-L-rhamnose 4-epimerase